MQILMLDDDERLGRSVSRLLRRFGHQPRHVRTITEARLAVADLLPDVVIADLGLAKGEQGIDFIQWIAVAHPAVRRVLSSGTRPPANFDNDPPRQVFLPKPFDAAELSKALAPG